MISIGIRLFRKLGMEDTDPIALEGESRKCRLLVAALHADAFGGGVSNAKYLLLFVSLECFFGAIFSYCIACAEHQLNNPDDLNSTAVALLDRALSASLLCCTRDGLSSPLIVTMHSPVA